VAVADRTIEDATSDAVLDFALDDALERTSPELRIVTLSGKQIFGSFGKLERDVAISEARAQTVDLDFDNLPDLSALERLEDDDFVDTVDKLGTKAFFAQVLSYFALQFILFHAIQRREPLTADVAGHDDHSVLEVDSAT